jgi:hypothetical protein
MARLLRDVALERGERRRLSLSPISLRHRWASTSVLHELDSPTALFKTLFNTLG